MAETVAIAVRVQPRARTAEIVGVRNGALVVRVTAPPLDGRANAAVCALLAARLGVRQASVVVVRGERSRDKLIEVSGAAPAALAALLGTAV